MARGGSVESGVGRLKIKLTNVTLAGATGASARLQLWRRLPRGRWLQALVLATGCGCCGLGAGGLGSGQGGQLQQAVHAGVEYFAFLSAATAEGQRWRGLRVCYCCFTSGLTSSIGCPTQ